LGGHPLILGRPWFDTSDAYIGCRTGSMIIFYGYDTKKLNLYPLAKPSMETENPFWFDCEEGDVQPMLTIGKAFSFKNETKDDTINSFISNPRP